MYSDEELSEEEIQRLREMNEQFQTEDAHGEGMEVDVTRESTNDVAPTINSDADTGLDLSFHKKAPKADKENPTFPSEEEAEDYFMSDEEKLQNQIASLEEQAKERESRIKQKQHLRELKKQVRSAKVREAVAPATERLEPLVSGGKKTIDILGKAGKKGSSILGDMGERKSEYGGNPFGEDEVSFGDESEPSEGLSEAAPGENQKMQRLGSAFDFGSKSSLGNVGRGILGSNVKHGEKELSPVTGKRAASERLQKHESSLGFSKKKGGLFDMGGRKEKMVDWGAKKEPGIGFGSKKETGISFDAKPGSGFSLFGEGEKSKRKSKKSKKNENKMGLGSVLGGK